MEDGKVTSDTSSVNASPIKPSSERSTLESIGLVAVCTMAMVVTTGNATSASIALPTVGRDLGIPEGRLQWIVSSYSLTSGCFLLLFGRIADIYGRKLTYLCGTLSLLAFTLACGFVKSEIGLDVLRGLQGVGTAATIPSALGILASSFPPSRARTIAFATFAAGAPIGAAIGITLGGVLTQLSRQTWRASFYLFTAINAVCLVVGFLTIPKDDLRDASNLKERIDWLGASLVTSGLVLIVFVLAEGELAPHKWSTPYIIVCIVLGIVLLIAFFAWQWYLGQPAALASSKLPSALMPLDLWKRARGRLAAVMWVAFLNWGCFISWNFWLQLFFQDYLRLTPILTMVRLLPMFVTGVICNIIIGVLAPITPAPILLGTGTALTAVAALLTALSTSHPSSPYWAYNFPSTILSVFGADFVFAAGTLYVASVVAGNEQSLAGAMFQTMTQLGTSVGLTVTTILFDKKVERGQVLKGYKDAQYGAFAFGVAATIVVAACLYDVGVIGGPKKAPLENTESEKE